MHVVAKKNSIRANWTYIAVSDSCLFRSMPRKLGLPITSLFDVVATEVVVVTTTPGLVVVVAPAPVVAVVCFTPEHRL